jgi:hypothetical protein
MKTLRLVVFVILVSGYALNMSAQEITVFQGMWGDEFYQDKEKISCKQFDMLMKENSVAEMHWQKSKKQMLGGLIAGTANLGAAIWYLANENGNKDTAAPIATFAGTAIIGTIFYLSANNNKKKAILEYNEGLGKKTSFRLLPTSSSNGVGLALQF